MTEYIATRDAYGQELLALGAENPRIVALDADLSGSTKTSLFARAYPERFFNMGIAEQDMMGFAAGLAAGGLIPFASTFAVFAAGRALEPIRNTIAYPRLNVKIAASHAGLSVGEDGASHQALEDVAWLRAVPHMTVLVPADAVETRLAVRAAATEPGPFYLRLGRPATPVLFGPDYRFAVGRMNVLREGRDLTIVANGLMLAPALRAAEILAAEGLTAAVLNGSSVKPFDAETLLHWAARTGAVVTAEEHSIVGGLGSAAAEILAEGCPVPLARVGIRDSFGESGEPEALLAKYGLTAEGVAAAARSAAARKLK
ncbi:MAG: transketolase family protein [Gracilibacteraceae bacterium]|jgi:transketolase|nr:transketolase family protein [Gracilibacteraceae bacterium]